MNPFRIPKPNRVVATTRAIPVWFRPAIKPNTQPGDWKVVKLSGDRVGYIKTEMK